MAKNYDWSMLPFKPHDEWLAKMLVKFGDLARTSGGGQYWIDGDEDVNSNSPDDLFHKFVIRQVQVATKAVKKATQSVNVVLAKKFLAS